MSIVQDQDIIITGQSPVLDSFKSEIIAGLKQSPKRIDSKFFYDERGSRLFEEITKLDEYYLTRAEIEILEKYLGEMSALIGDGAVVVEFGTGAGVKTRMLLDALVVPHAYIPIDISREQLIEASSKLSERFTSLDIRPVCADYTSTVPIPLDSISASKRVVFFPGSTIGNFTPEEAIAFLRQAAKLAGADGALLIGFDRNKSTKVIEAAYNDSRGITAEFNLNLIKRINQEFSVNVPVKNFDHFAFFNSEASRIEMHIVSRVEQALMLDGEEIRLGEEEHIITEYSYKYSSPAFQHILRDSGFSVQERWTDSKGYFEMCYCTTAHK